MKTIVNKINSFNSLLGEHVGGLLEIGYHMHGNDIRGALVRALEDADNKRKLPLS